ncbi:hypothetical protein [Lysobacter sp. Root494]|uniref:hypothetical protein n=1 Tax=Lysobacter sp. Root494 TaxID=1736549 RepID=UPI0012FC4DAC|nr:hypothetical protein [Lysobacter sp. Root494]
MLSPIARLTLHCLLMIAMVTATVAVPAQAASDTLEATAAAKMAAAMADMPCADMAMSHGKAPHKAPCDCCNPVSCDLSACLGTACLPELPRVVATVPGVTLLIPWQAPASPSQVIDTPLRPPIA